MIRIVAIALLGGVSACASVEPSGVVPPGALVCDGTGANTYYFPAGALNIEGAPGVSDDFVRRWYSAHLLAMNEPSLSCGAPSSDEAYRFLWLRSFHQPIAVRVSRAGRSYELVATALSGAGGYEPGRVVQRVRRELTEDEWRRVTHALQRISFWQMSANPPTEEIGVDGAQWIIEGRSASYHVVDRWSGDDGVAAVGDLFLDLSDIRVRGPVY